MLPGKESGCGRGGEMVNFCDGGDSGGQTLSGEYPVAEAHVKFSAKKAFKNPLAGAQLWRFKVPYL